MKTSDRVDPPSRKVAQEVVLSFFDSQLSRPEDHIRTHCAHIFLIDDKAYKIKSDVRFSYLDMTTLNTRKQLCERELEINAPVLPGIYLAVVPVTMNDMREISIDGSGIVVEWALKMRRFDEENVLENIAIRGDLGIAMAKDMGRSLAEYHSGLSSLNVTDGYLRIQEVQEELHDELGLLDTVFTPEQLGKFEYLGKRTLFKCRHHLDQRAQDGYIKRCHGDLHLRNILMTPEGPTPFDALEFDERMATTDILYDIAFLLMDMVHRDLLAQSNALLNAYLLHSPPKQFEGLRHLPLFLYTRAAIRAMTTAQAAKQQTQVEQTLLGQARQYLAEANAYLQNGKPRLVAIGGLSGSGKSSVSGIIATQLCPAPGAVLLRSDAERKKLAGVRESARLPQSYYTKEWSIKVYQILFYKAQMALNSGATVIIDAVFHEEEQRIKVQDIACRENVLFSGCWLEAPTTILKQRISQRRNDASDADVQVLQKQLLKATGFLKWAHIDAGGTLTQTIDNVINEIGVS